MKRIVSIAAFLALLGIVVSADAPRYPGEPRMAVWLQSVFALLGTTAFLAVRRLDFRRVLSRPTGILLAVMAVQLAAILIPIHFPRQDTPEDSEVSLAAAFILSRFLSQAPLLTLFALPLVLATPSAQGALRRHACNTEVWRFAWALLPAFILGMLVLAQPSVAVFIAILLIALTVAWLAGHRLRYVVGLVLSFIVYTVVVAIFWAPERLERILALWGDFLSPHGSLRCVPVTEMLIRDGGLWGRGLGSRTHAVSVARSLCDQVAFAYVGHVTGLWGTCLVTALFTALGWLGLGIAAKAPTLRRRVCAAGMVLCVLLPAFGHIWYNTGLSFTGHYPLPFVSSEAGNLLLPWCALGLLASLSRRRCSATGLDNSQDSRRLSSERAAFRRRIHVLQASLVLIALITFARLWFLANRWSA